MSNIKCRAHGCSNDAIVHICGGHLGEASAVVEKSSELRGADAELAKVVAWLREQYHPPSIPGQAATALADALERKEHRG